MLENKTTKNQGIHYSRYIASWRNEGGSYFGEQFAKWLAANFCTEQEIREIREMAECGKLELEISARKFITKMKEMIQKIENDEDPEEEP